MSEEITKAYTANLTNMYAIVYRNNSGTWQPWDVTNSQFTTYNAANIDDYDIAMTEAAHGWYSADFPTAITTAAVYSVVIYSGDKAGDDDTVVDSISVNWNGSSEIAQDTDEGQLASLTNFKEYYGL